MQCTLFMLLDPKCNILSYTSPHVMHQHFYLDMNMYHEYQKEIIDTDEVKTMDNIYDIDNTAYGHTIVKWVNNNN